MSRDADKTEREQRWARLMELHACEEASPEEERELIALASEKPDHAEELQSLQALAQLVPDHEPLTERDQSSIEQAIAAHADRVRKRRTTIVRIAIGTALIPLAAAAAIVGFRDAQKAPVTPLHPSSAESATVEVIRHSVPPEAGLEPPASEGRSSDSTGAPAGASDPPPSATHLLAKAQKERSQKQYAQALKSYQSLFRLYPTSKEASLARVSAAQLMLSQGQPGPALAAFDAYERSGGGALAQEAHYGKIQALRALGRAEQERTEIRRFLELYPSSLQSASLKRRLGEALEKR
jgi:tetratricopeptide (TPR) repeat protein